MRYSLQLSLLIAGSSLLFACNQDSLPNQDAGTAGNHGGSTASGGSSGAHPGIDSGIDGGTAGIHHHDAGSAGSSQFGDVHDPYAWPNSEWIRPTSLNVESLSKEEESRSHPKSDARWGQNCMRCHQEFGPGLGIFSVAGSIQYEPERLAMPIAIELIRVTPGDNWGDPPKSVDIIERFPIDNNGNFFSTQAMPYEDGDLAAQIVSIDGTVLKRMKGSKGTGACNTCHIDGFALHLESD